MKGLTKHIIRENGTMKTICVSNCLAYFGIAPSDYRNTWNGTKNTAIDILRSKGFGVRSRKSSMGTASTVGQIRSKINNLPNIISQNGYPSNVLGYYVTIQGHGLVLDTSGNTVVDTAPRKRDKRKVFTVHAITR